MLMQASVHALFLVLLAIALRGHVLLAEASLRSRGARASGTRALHSLILEAAQSG
jgi:hypothetical protein